jgi:hypothetical protein
MMGRDFEVNGSTQSCSACSDISLSSAIRGSVRGAKHQGRGGIQTTACCPPALYPSKQLLYLSSEQLPVALLFALPQLACQLQLAALATRRVTFEREVSCTAQLTAQALANQLQLEQIALLHPPTRAASPARRRSSSTVLPPCLRYQSLKLLIAPTLIWWKDVSRLVLLQTSRR